MRKYRVIVVGGRKKADYIVQSLLGRKMEVTVVNDTEDFCVEMSHKYPHALVACGDGTKPFLYEDLHIENADIFIAMMPSDADNLVAAQMAKEQFKVQRVFCTVSNPGNVEIFKKLGIKNVISSTYIVSRMIEQLAVIKEIDNYLPLENGRVAVLELKIDEYSLVANKKLNQLTLPKESIIACIIRGAQTIIPNGETQILPFDKCVVVVNEKSKDEIIAILTKGNGNVS